MANRRRFTPQFKAEVVIEALSGQSSYFSLAQAELCRKHNLSADQLSKWKHQLVDNAASLFESTDKQSLWMTLTNRLLNCNSGSDG